MMMKSTLFQSYTLSASSLKQQSGDRHVVLLRHIILFPSQPVFVLSPECCVLNGEATNTNLIVFGLTRSGLEPTIYRTQGEHANHYATDVVQLIPVNLNYMVLYSLTQDIQHHVLIGVFVVVLKCQLDLQLPMQ